ncbi:hypothetical protein KIW84_075801 [Lathyrus oleraceus]|uniref:Zinc finger ZPR1-type domain-containing protein n=1 Tax=Pisum sativum TaxID=3888 RepID=A0A9D5A1I1_PEA|nr:hypothetical protein KIW84_075801 [Pisum sativum]
MLDPWLKLFLLKPVMHLFTPSKASACAVIKTELQDFIYFNFRKILLLVFECPHCGERNHEVQFAGETQPHGCCYSLEIPAGEQKMFNRQVVKSESAIVKIPELEFEIPPEAQHGILSTVEGMLMRAVDELQALQEERRKVALETDEGTRDEVLESGEATTSRRTSRQPHGSVGAAAGQRAIAQSNSAGIPYALFRYSALEEVMTFPSTCGTCTSKCETRMLSLIFRIFKKKGHSNIWYLCAAIARGHVLEHMEVDSRKQLWSSFHICHQIKVKDGKVYLILLELIVDKPPPSAPSEQFSPEFCSFISACVQKDPGNRLSVQELLELPFISMYDDQHVDLSAYFSKAGSPLATL